MSGSNDVNPIGQSLTPGRFRTVMGQFATGVSVVTFRTPDGPGGMTANAFLSVSLDPPLVLVSVRKRARLLSHVGMGDVFGINVLADDQAATSDYFGGRGGAICPAVFRDDQAAPLLIGCLACIVARVVDLHPAGDHRLMIGRVEALEDGAASPLLLYGGRYLAREGAKVVVPGCVPQGEPIAGGLSLMPGTAGAEANRVEGRLTGGAPMS